MSTIVFGSVLPALHFFTWRTEDDGQEHVNSLYVSKAPPAQLCVLVRGVHELKEGDTNMVKVSAEACRGGIKGNFVQSAHQIRRWADFHAAEIRAIQKADRELSCHMRNRETLPWFENVSRMDSISAILSQQSLSVQNISNYFTELVTLALTAESRLARAEHLYGKCLCRQKPPPKFVSWGAWCARTQLDPEKRKRACNYRLADYLADKLFDGCSVADIGAGAGTYSQYMLSRVKRKPKVMAPFDGGIGVDEVTNGLVNYANLAKPLRLRVDAPAFDWVMSLEVAEHIPREAETIFVNNLVRRAAKGIVISWAIPGQDGVGHVNERSHAYVVRRFSRLGFKLDAIQTENARKASLRMHGLKHFSRTLHVFRRQSDLPSKEQLLWDPQNEQLEHNKSDLACTSVEP